MTFLMVAVSSIVLSLSVAARSGENMVSNPSFETVAAGETPAYWQFSWRHDFYNDVERGIQTAVDSHEARFGRRSIRIDVSRPHGNSVFSTACIPIDPAILSTARSNCRPTASLRCRRLICSPSGK